MATVYLAQDLKHDRKVAIKVLKPELAAVLGADRFVVEIKTTAALSHPHILPLFDSGTADGFLYYVMPFIKGETIREKLNRETQFGVDEAVRIAREVADALDYAHRNGVIHRDIKPENLLLHDGRAMVMDFGIALALSAAAGGRMTETGLSLGTPHYMSPEQATADKDLSGRSDVYSLASVLYEMLTGQPPHVGASAQQIIMKIIAEPVQPVTAFRKSVPPNVAAAVSRALEKLPADRFETAKAFSDALVNPSYATAATTGLATGVTGARAVPLTVFAAAVAVAVLAMAVAAWRWRTPAPPAAVTRLSLALPDSQELSHNFQTTRIAISPDGRQLVTVSRGTGSGRHLFVRSLDQLRAVSLPGTESAMNPSFSPDGRRVAFVTSAPRGLRVATIAGGPVTPLTDSLVDLGGVSWGRDGYIYYDAHLEGDGVARIRESGGAPEIATRPDSTTGEQYHVNPSALPDGRGILFSISRVGGLGSWDIGVQDAKTRMHTVLVRGVQAQYSPSGHLLYVTDEGLLMAAPFDLDKLRITGEPVAMAEGVAVRGNGRVDLSISDDGVLTYTSGIVSGGIVEFVWVTRDGVVTRVDPGFARAFGGRPSLSPDGRSLATSITEDAARSIWVKQLDRGPMSKVAPSGVRPSWTPDGKSIVFASFANVMRVPADGSALPTQLFAGANTLGPLEITRDGKWLLYATGGMGGIVGRRLDGDTATRVFVSDQAVLNWPSVSPDGRWLAYSSDETGRYEVYVRPFAQPETAKRQVSADEGFTPRWSSNGRELYFIDGSGDVIAVPVLPGTAFSFGAPVRLFSTNPFAIISTLFEVAPDGRFLLSRPIGAEEDRADEVILVQNFFEELKAKVKLK